MNEEKSVRTRYGSSAPESDVLRSAASRRMQSGSVPAHMRFWRAERAGEDVGVGITARRLSCVERKS